MVHTCIADYIIALSGGFAPQETKSVEVDVVQRVYSPALTVSERAALSAFVNDMLAWCTRDIILHLQ